MKCNFKKVLFGLSVSLVLAMAIGSFAIGETQTPVTPQATAQNEAVSATYDDFEVSGDTSTISFSNSVLTISGGEHTISMVQGVESTSDRINVTGSATITLAGVNISTSTGSAMDIDGSANVTVLLADGYTNTLTATSDDYAGLHKGDGGNTLTIGVPSGSQGDGILNVTGGYGGAGIGGNAGSTSDITISGGIVKANGGEDAAGIGGGSGGSGSDITISGGNVTATSESGGAGIGGGTFGDGSNITISGGTVTANGGYAGAGIGGGVNGGIGSQITISGGTVTATGGYGGAGIGGGYHVIGSTGNSISSDNVVVIAESGDASKAALEGFSGIDKGLIFTKQGSSGSWGVTMYNNVVLASDLAMPENATLTIPQNNSLTINAGKTLTIPDGSALTNEGTLTINGTISCVGTGEVTTKTDFYREGSEAVYKTDYQTYQTVAGQQKYTNLPNPDDTTLLKNSLNSDKFLYWYYLDKDGKEVAIKDGDAGDDVLPNQHDFYEKREEAYTISTSKQGEGTITPNVSEAYKDDEVTFTVTPAEGYELQEGSLSVKAGDKDVEFTEKDGKYTFTMPDSAVTISAVFEQIPEPTPTPPGPEPTPTPPGPEPQPTPPGPEPEPTPEPTPDPSVNPDGSGGASSKTGDPFMGGIALALLGVATTGAVLVRKRK